MNEQVRDGLHRLAGHIEERTKAWQRQQPEPAVALRMLEGWKAEANRLGLASVGALETARSLIAGEEATKGLPLKPSWPTVAFALDGAAKAIREATHEEPIVPLYRRRSEMALKATEIVNEMTPVKASAAAQLASEARRLYGAHIATAKRDGHFQARGVVALLKYLRQIGQQPGYSRGSALGKTVGRLDYFLGTMGRDGDWRNINTMQWVDSHWRELPSLLHELDATRSVKTGAAKGARKEDILRALSELERNARILVELYESGQPVRLSAYALSKQARRLITMYPELRQESHAQYLVGLTNPKGIMLAIEGRDPVNWMRTVADAISWARRSVRVFYRGKS